LSEQADLKILSGELAIDLVKAAGIASWLSTQDILAFSWSTGEFCERIFQSIACGQAALFKDGARPLAFISWCQLSEELDQKYRLQKFYPSREERVSGDRLWLLDALVLSAHEKQVAHGVLNQLFDADTVVRWLSRGKAGKTNKIVAGKGGVEILVGNWP